ncbi:MAG: PEP-CTERM sorting domain-containing protein, partial [Rhodocyclaceae bacterium]|nr:PEP-CTERM sorting domain-containing protein [Rhodocyclaceae bacterium]
ELAYMYYVNLGLKGFYSPTGAGQPDWGIFRNGTFGDQADVGPVKNLKSSYGYWSGSAYARNPAVYAWHFDTDYGYQYVSYDASYAWAVRPGDVAAVPEPETYAMFLAGLAVLGRAMRRRRGSGPS